MKPLIATCDIKAGDKLQVDDAGNVSIAREPERLVMWVQMSPMGFVSQFAFDSAARNFTGTRMVQCAPDELPISHKQLAEAWDKFAVYSKPLLAWESTSFKLFCKHIGFEEEK